MLQAKNINHAFGANQVLFDLSFELKAGELVGIIGPNGAGKSTFLKILAGLLKAQKGRILLENTPLEHYSTQQLAKKRAYVPQELVAVFDYSVEQIVAMGRFPFHSSWKPLHPQDLAVVEQALQQMELLPLRKRAYNQLSGGEKQRAVIASALTQQAPLMLLDEPTSALDLQHQQKIFRFLRQWVEHKNHSIITVTHDINLAAQFCHRLLLMHKGRIVADGSPNEVLQFSRVQSVYGVKVYIDINPFTDKVYILPYDIS